MIEDRIYEHTHASLLKLTNLLAAEFGGTGVNLDAYADSDSLPEGDLIGLDGVSFREEDVGYSAMFSISVITENDTNNMKLSKTISDVFNRLRTEKQIDLYHCDTGERLGNLTMVGPAQLAPVARASATKAMQTVTTAAVTIFAPTS